MDINYLLALQNFRDTSGGFLADFMNKMTFLGELNTLLVILAILYWCIDKDLGNYLIMGFGANRLVNGFLKITACVYRPWIRDARIVPYGDATKTATGYSFPSGHTTNAGTLFGGGALRKNCSAALRIILIILVILVGLSRNFLGVHTPQDVIVGGCASIFVMWLVCRLMQYLDDHPEKDLMVVCIGVGLCILLSVYAALKPYPADYDADGKLIVDGAKMARDTFKAVGYTLGILAGWILERRFVNFSTNITLPVKAMRCVTGLLCFYIISLIISPLLKDILPSAPGALIPAFLQLFFITFIWPWCFKSFEK